MLNTLSTLIIGYILLTWAAKKIHTLETNTQGTHQKASTIYFVAVLDIHLIMIFYNICLISVIPCIVF